MTGHFLGQVTLEAVGWIGRGYECRVRLADGTPDEAILTEAAGEGINLQFCRLMINYDPPWNPMRLEQRLARIHRIGRERDVHAFNFVTSESHEGQPIIEGRILERLLHKIEQMRSALSDRVFDVIGEVLSLNDVNLPEILREAANDPWRLDEYLDQMERVDPEQTAPIRTGDRNCPGAGQCGFFRLPDCKRDTSLAIREWLRSHGAKHASREGCSTATSVHG